MSRWFEKYVTGGGCSKRVASNTARKRFSAVIAVMMAIAITCSVAVPGAYANPLEDLGNAISNGVNSIMQVFAPRAATTGSDREADGSTKDTFTASLGNDTSTRSNGRVWVDKSVSKESSVSFGAAGSVENDSDFLVTYSALAASTAVSGETQVPVDVVFVIDNSNSMDEDLSGNQTRLEATVDAVNTSIAQIMESNEASRVAVVLYGLEAETLLPLDHYEPMNNGDYISVESEYINGGWSGTSGYETTFTGSGSHSVVMEPGERGTNTHIGVDAGFTILNDARDTGEGANQHVPAVVILSDGAATSSGGNDWWNPSGKDGDGTETADSYALKIAMNAQYNKQLVNQHYGVANADSDYACKVYTIGMGIEQLHESEWGADNTDYHRAQIALDPGAHLTDSNDVANNIEDAWDWYINGKEVNIGGPGRPNYVTTYTPELDGYTFEHPGSNDISTIAYNDGYYAAENAEDVANVFDDITSSIVMARPSVPTATDPNRPADSGYISYEDTTGAYMEIKDVKRLIWADRVFTNPTKVTDDQGNTTYTFVGEISSEVYGEQNANLIKITVKKNDDNTQTIKVDIPAAAIPLRVNTISLDDNGNVKSNEPNEAMPLRVCYTVGFAEDIDPTTLGGVAADYVNANLDAQTGKVNFYSNAYSKNEDNERIGAKATFTPAQNNPYYFFQEDTPIYVDQDGNTRATKIEPNGTYYVPVTYYNGFQEVTDYVARTGDSFDSADLLNEADGVKVKAFAERLANLDFATATKGEDGVGANNTDTASTYRYPISNDDGSFTAYLGNNGRLQLDAPASLVIAKAVTAEEGLTAPDATFTFQVTSAAKADQMVSATKTLESGETETTQIEFDSNGAASVELKGGDSIEITGMSGADYSIVEKNLPSGFAVSKIEGADDVDNDSHTASGTVAAGSNDETVTFTNTYSVEPVTTEDLNIDLSGSKTISGRDFQADDTFTFSIAPAQLTPNAPLPTEDVDSDGSPTTATVEPTSGTSVTFEFGDITFTEPGEYRYVVRESTGNLPGVDYDTALFRVNIIVEDDGQGELVLADATGGNLVSDLEGGLVYPSNPFIQTWDGTQQGDKVDAIKFENTYSATEAPQAIQGTKVLNATNSDMQLADEQFTFKIEALGYNTDGGDNFNSIPAGDPAQPMPVNAETKNVANGNVIFGNMTFTQDMIGNTYGYKVTELLPQGVNDDNPTLNGMTYDTDEKIVKVAVTRSDEGGAEHVVATVTPNDGIQEDANNFTFTNSYKPSSTTIGDGAVAGITVEKSFTGHTWTDDYNFEFTITDDGNTAGLDANPMPADTTIEIGAPQGGTTNTGAFGSMTFEKAGTYTYTISETKGSNKGITYGGSVEVKVVVTEDKQTGTLSAQVIYGQNQQLAHFDNTYTATFDDDTAVTLNAVKNLEVADGFTYPLRGETIDGSFFFTVTPLDGAPGAPSSAVSNSNSEKVVDSNDWTSTIALFNNLTFTMDDMDGQASRTFSYVVTEQAGNVAGMTYDTTAYKVDITVTDNGEGVLSAAKPVIIKGTYANGTFTAAEDQSGVSDIVFTNNYGDSIQDAAIAPLAITKNLTGDRATGLQQGEFTFTMTVDEANPKDGVTLPSPAMQTNDADGSVKFGNIVFSKPGDYKISVSEVIPEDAVENEDSTYTLDGVTYDNHKITTTFEVRDNNGTLLALRHGTSGSQTFTNKYNATGATDSSLTGVKTIDGRSFQNDDAFTFQVTGSRVDMAADEQIPLPKNVTRTEAVEGTVSNTGTITINPTSGTSADIDFGSIAFTKPGTYTYRISEQTSTIGGINIDTTVYLVTYEVTDQSNGKLEVSGPELAIENAGEGVAAPTQLAWKNVYDDGEVTLSGTTDLTVTKNFTGRDWRDDDVFTFTLAADGEVTQDAIGNGDIVMPATLTITVDKTTPNFAASFGDIVFKADGTYTFTVKEDDGGLDNVGYDTTPHKITVVVTDDNQGHLAIDADKTTGTSANGSDALTFTNVYTPDDEPFDPSTGAGVQVKKVLEGRTPGLQNGEFSFVMSVANRDGSELDDSKITLPTNLTATNDADGNVDFGDIIFTGEGAYTVTIKEDVPSDDAKAPYIYYDTHEFKYDIDVTYNSESGAYEVKTSNVSGDPTFTNTYNKPEDTKDVLTDADDPSTSVDGQTVTVGSELTYVITWNNDAMDDTGKTVAAVVMVTDVVPVGMEYVEGSANPEPASFEDGKLIWNLGEQQPGATGKISFKVRVTEDAVTEGEIKNTAEIQLGENDPKQTTTPSVTVENGTLSISKRVTVNEEQDVEIDAKHEFDFTVEIKDAGGNALNGTYTAEYSASDEPGTLAFDENGRATVTLKHGESVTIKGLPEGAIYTVTENLDNAVSGDDDYGYKQTVPADGAAAKGAIEDGKTATAAFENAYSADPTDVPSTGETEKAFNLTKQLTGRDENNSWSADDEFSFTLTPGKATDLEGNPVEGLTVPMPADSADGIKKVTVGAAKAGEKGIASIDFGAIRYERTGIYTYTVTEENGGNTANGITYDGRTVNIKVTVTDNGTGGLVAAVEKTDEAVSATDETKAVSFKNSYSSTFDYGANGKGGIDITKMLKNRDMIDGQFTFTVTAADDASADKIGGSKTVELKSVAAAANTAASVSGNPFGSVKFDRSDSGKTFTYTIEETGTAPDGYTYDTDVFTVEIKPVDNGDGTMTVTTDVSGKDGYSQTVTSTMANPQKATVTFVNIYDADDVTIGAEGDATIKATKVLENDDIANYDGKFTFKVTSGDTVVATGENDADGSITFEKITYTSENLYAAAHGGSDEVGTASLDTTGDKDVYTFVYGVTEDPVTVGGVTYKSGNDSSVTVTVTDDRAGKLTIDVAYTPEVDGLVFTNTYGAGEEGAVQLTLDGNKTLTGVDGAIPPTLSDGMFEFTITGEDGAPMPKTTTVPNKGTGISFGPIEYTMENVFGADAADEATEDEAVDQTDEAVAGETATAENEGAETYTADRNKTFIYTITETNGGKTIGGITYDGATKTVEVTVTDEGNGKISAVVTKVTEGTDENMDFTFDNTYAVEDEPSTPTGEGGLTVTKKLSGRDMKAGEFTFQLVENVEEDAQDYTATNDDKGNVSFDPITFTKAGEYSYTLTEVVPDGAKPVDGGYEKDGVFYPSVSYTVTATVTDNHDGTLTVVWSMADGAGEPATEAVFENTYAAAPTSAALEAAKALEGRAVQKGEFSFKLFDADGNVVDEATNDENGVISFESLTFEKAGTYTYTVSEVVPEEDQDPDTDGVQNGGITYDQTVYTVEIVVKDNGKGSLVVDSITYKIGDEVANALLFKNIYKTQPTDPTDPTDDESWLKVTKDLANRDLEAGEFTFQMRYVSGGNADAVTPKSITTTNDANGNVVFDQEGNTGFVFSEEGEYTFVISEIEGDDANIDYDDTEYTVVAKVTKNAETGELEVTWQLLDAEGNVVTENPSITFHNVYEKPVTPPTPDPDPSDPSKPDTDVDKKLTGRDLVDGEFSFVITATGDNASHVSPKSLTGTNDASGNVTFGGKGFVFDKVGDYTFIVSEVLPADDDPETEGVQHNGVTYDETTFTITAHVTKQGNKLVVTWENADAPMVFENEYEPSESVDITFGATKVLEGRDLATGEFSFELRDQDGNVVATATNTADGSIVFTSPVTFTEPGEYTYTIVEVSGNVSGVTYDDAVHTAVVTVTDNGDGTLSATVTYDGSGKLPVFTNVFTPSEPSAPAEPGKPSKPGIPQTGDFAAAAIGGTGLAAVALIATGLYLRRRNSH